MGYKVAWLLLLTILVVIAALITLPMLFNQTGWVGFFSVPVMGFAVVAVLVAVWVEFFKRNFKKGN